MALSLWIASAGLAGERPATPKYGGTLRIAIDGTIQAIDPYKGTRFRQHFGFTRLYAEGLVDMDKQADLVPGLAESWEISPDGREYTFKLRKGIKFHNGEDLTSEDVRFSFEHASDRKNAAQYRTNLDLVESIEAADRYVVKIRLKKASTPFLSNIYAGFVPVMSRKSLATLDTAPVGTGPFAYVEWKPGLHVKFRRFKDYWKQGRPYVDEVVFRFAADETVRYTGLRAGDLEIADELPPQVMAELKGASQKGYRYVGIPGGSYMILMLNTRRPPLTDVRVRQAIASALDKQEILDATRWGAGEGTNQLHAKGSPWRFDVEDRKRDLSLAKKLLTEAGFPQGFAVPVLASQKYVPTAQIIQAQLKPLGIHLEFQQVDDATRLARENKADFDTDLRGMGYPMDPDRYFIYFYSKTGTRNFTGYNNAEFDRLYERAQVEQDFQKRKQMYTEMLKMIQRDVPEILLWSGHRFIGWRDHVKGFEPNPAAVTLYHGGGLETTWIDSP
jgi:peptide/nickel transport system substrate-binding protein